MTSPGIQTRHRLLAPEVVQTSAMDCGPASLKCLLEGFGIPVSYGRLREACQTDVDGTSIDTLEEVAGQLGLAAEQIMIPVDHLLLREAQALPAIVVVRLPNGITHFIVVWRRFGPFVQVMDPETGRRWITRKMLLDELYVHTLPIPAGAWCEWTSSDGFLNPLRRRLANLGLSRRITADLIGVAQEDAGWRSFAALDAATRMVTAIIRAGGLRRGRQAGRVLEHFFARARSEPFGKDQTIPPEYWSVHPVPAKPDDSDGEEQLLLRGAVLVHVEGRRPQNPPHPEETTAATIVDEVDESPPLSPELMAALEEQPTRPGLELLRLLRVDGLLAPTVLLAALVLAAGIVVIEALLFRGLLDLGNSLRLPEQRLGAIIALLIFVATFLLLELPLIADLLRLGRRIETRLRVAFLSKIPRLGDRYFQSRLISDMAERSHSVHKLRLLPALGGQLLRFTFELILTTVGIIWLDPASTPVAILAAVFAVGLPLAAHPVLAERDLRVRTHTGALGRFYLDALLGLVPVRTHGAEQAVRREHESLLVEWARASLRLLRPVVAVEGVQTLVSFGLAAWLLFAYLAREGTAGGVLLLVYWALILPVLGYQIALLARQYPVQRNVTLRLLEPLGAPERTVRQKTAQNANAPLGGTNEKSRNYKTTKKVATDHQTVSPTHHFCEASVSSSAKEPAKSPQGVTVDIQGVTVRLAGHTILTGLNLRIEAGSHVAIVGRSGAGKSSLVGLLLGWHRPATGQVLINGQPLDSECLDQLRQETAWVDPTVQLWNRSFLDNLIYGTPAASMLPVGQIIAQADLLDLLEKMPDGLQTALGEGGALVSGGEGQRVRFGRAMLRPGVRLVILDEPFRGLDRERRRELLARARCWWRDATLLCITHDVSETQGFERVLVIEDGQVAEDGPPAELAARSGSRYRTLLAADEAVRKRLWSSHGWRRLRLEEGMLFERG